MQNYFGQRPTNFFTSGHPGWNVFYKGKGKMDKKRRTCVVKGGKIENLVVATERCSHHKNFLGVGILSPNKISLRRRHLISPRKISSRNKMTKYLFSNSYFTNPCFTNPAQSYFTNPCLQIHSSPHFSNPVHVLQMQYSPCFTICRCYNVIYI